MLRLPGLSDPGIQPTRRNAVVAFLTLFLLVLSLPPKWPTLHLAGLILVLFALAHPRRLWSDTAARTYLGLTLLWFGPVLATAALQIAGGLGSAPEPGALALLSLRILGIGLGLIWIVRAGWLDLHGAAIAVLGALAFHVGAGLYEWLTQAGAVGWRGERINGLTFNPNPFGMFMALTAILAAGIARMRDAPRRLLISLSAVALVCIWASGSRGALLAALAGFVVLYPPNTLARAALIGTAGLAAAAGIWLSGAGSGMVASNDERLMALMFSLDLIRESPWLGWGYNAYEHLPGRYGPGSPHNMLLELWVSSGFVALAGWIVSTGVLAVQLARRATPAAQVVLALLVAACIAGILEYSLTDSTHFRGTWVILTALACCILAPPVIRPTNHESARSPILSLSGHHTGTIRVQASCHRSASR